MGSLRLGRGVGEKGPLGRSSFLPSFVGRGTIRYFINAAGNECSCVCGIL